MTKEKCNCSCKINDIIGVRSLVGQLEKSSPKTAQKYRNLLETGKENPCWITRAMLLNLLCLKQNQVLP